MRSHHEQIDPMRLTDAADIVLEALGEVCPPGSGPCPYPPDLLGSPEQPVCMCDLTRYEAEEATLFLMRLGLLTAVADTDS